MATTTWSTCTTPIDPVVAAGLVDYITPDYQVTDEVSLFPTPGHTPGHVSVLIRSQGQEAVITGDLMHHPIQLVEPLRPGNFDMDKPQGGLTRQAFVERFGDSQTADHRQPLLRPDRRLDRARRPGLEAQDRMSRGNTRRRT